MLQICTFGEGATRHYNSTGRPGNMAGDGMTMTEYTSHLSVWAIMGSPLIQSADLRSIKQRHPECLDLMLNEEIIAVNQDVFASATLLYTETNVTGAGFNDVNSTRIVGQAWGRRLDGGRAAVVLLNRGEQARSMTVAASALGFSATESLDVRDVVARAKAGTVTGKYTVTVAPHAVSFVVLSPTTFNN